MRVQRKRVKGSTPTHRGWIMSFLFFLSDNKANSALSDYRYSTQNETKCEKREQSVLPRVKKFSKNSVV